MKLKNINEEMNINATAEKMWESLSQYGDVSKFHAGVENSHNADVNGFVMLLIWG